MKNALIATTRTYAIGDPHGMCYEFESLINMIEDDLGKNPVPQAKIVVMGDIIDRGNDSAGLVQTIVDLPKRFPSVEIIAILGNHDRHLLQIADGNLKYLTDWRSDDAGGKCTLRDYGVDPNIASNKISEALTQALPAEHLVMFRNMPLLFDDGKTVFTHAGIRPGVAISNQLEED